MCLLSAAAPVFAHDFSSVPKVVLGIALLQAAPLLWLVGWRIPRTVASHFVVMAASWVIAVGGLFALESPWPLLVLFAPWAAFGIVVLIRQRSGENGP